MMRKGQAPVHVANPNNALSAMSNIACTYTGMNRTVAIDAPKVRPRSALQVGIVGWSWSPMHSRMDTYHLSSNRSRTHWILWQSVFDELACADGPSEPYAYCLRRNVPKPEAARALLLAGWQGESADWVAMSDEPMEPFHQVLEGGLLTKRQWLAMRSVAWPIQEVDT